MYSCDTSSAHYELGWLIQVFFLEEDRSLDTGAARDMQRIERMISSVFVLYFQPKFSLLCNIAS